MKDDLAGIAVFLKVAEKQSFTAAAGELGVTGSAVGQTVQQLEQRLGVRLLQRTTRSVGLTEAGERLYAGVAPAYAQVRMAIESLSELRERPVGTLRLTVPRTAGPFLYDRLLNEFMAEYPDILIDICFEEGLTDIVAQGFDAGVRLGEIIDKDMIAVAISGPQRMAVVGSRDYFAKHGKPKHPREVLGHACVGYRHVSTGALYQWEFDEAGKTFEVAIQPRIITNDVAHMLRLAVDGLAIVILFEDQVRAHLESGELVRVLEEFCAPFPGFYLYYPSRAHTPLKLSALANFLRKRLRVRKR
jgi:DNA-binding transcriptional LysR family regulator